MSKRTNTTCAHPIESRFAWTYYDAGEESHYLAQGCTVCGAVITGAAELRDCVATPTGPQHRLSPKKRKRKKATATAEATE